MKKLGPMLATVTCVVTLSCAMLAFWLVFWPGGTAAQAPPPPPPNTPTNTPITPEQPTNTPVTPEQPTNTPVTPEQPTNTPVTPEQPTNTPVTPEQPTNTPVTPPAATDTAVPPTPKPTKESQPSDGSEGTNPDCRSRVEGSVVDASGQGVRGATVTIQGEGWSSGTLTNDNGQYGFAGLCAGTSTLSATLPDGQPGAVATVSFDGQNSVYLDLGVSQNSATTPTASTGKPAAAQQTPIAEADMPATGFSGWLLAGATLLGALLLASAGARRVLFTSEQSRRKD
jgi:hypothetical protein